MWGGVALLKQLARTAVANHLGGGKKKVLLWLWMALLTAEIQAIKCKRKVCATGASFCIAEQQDSRTDSKCSSQSSVAGGSAGVSSHSKTPANPLYCLWWWSCCSCHGLHVAVCYLLYAARTDLERLCAQHSGTTSDKWREPSSRTQHPPTEGLRCKLWKFSKCMFQFTSIHALGKSKSPSISANLPSNKAEISKLLVHYLPWTQQKRSYPRFSSSPK